MYIYIFVQSFPGWFHGLLGLGLWVYGFMLLGFRVLEFRISRAMMHRSPSWALQECQNDPLFTESRANLGVWPVSIIISSPHTHLSHKIRLHNMDSGFVMWYTDHHTHHWPTKLKINPWVRTSVFFFFRIIVWWTYKIIQDHPRRSDFASLSASLTTENY